MNDQCNHRFYLDGSKACALCGYTIPESALADDPLYRALAEDERLEELREEVADLTELWEEEGAEWGDRLAEASGKLAALERRLGSQDGAAVDRRDTA
jgi:hypothetical protein